MATHANSSDTQIARTQLPRSQMLRGRRSAAVAVTVVTPWASHSGAWATAI